MRLGGSVKANEALSSSTIWVVEGPELAEEKGTRSLTRIDPCRRRVVVGADDPTVTSRAGLLLVAEVDRVLGVTEAFETSVGWLKQRRRGLGIGEVLLSAAESMLADGEFMCDLDHLRADRAGAALGAVPEAPAPSTFALAAGRLGRRGVAQVEAGMGTLISRWFAAVPTARRAQLGSCRPSIDLDGTDIEVCGRKKEAVAWNHEGRRVGRAHPATWAEAKLVIADDLGSGSDDPRPQAPGLIARAVTNLPEGRGRPRVRAGSGYFDAKVARGALAAGADFAIAAKRGAAAWKFGVNQAWMWSAYLATTLSVFTQTLGRVDADGVRAHAKRARQELFCLPARVLSHARSVVPALYLWIWA